MKFFSILIYKENNENKELLIEHPLIFYVDYKNKEFNKEVSDTLMIENLPTTKLIDKLKSTKELSIDDYINIIISYTIYDDTTLEFISNTLPLQRIYLIDNDLLSKFIIDNFNKIYKKAFNKDISNKDISNKDIPNKDIPNKDIPNKDISKEDISKKDIPNELLEKSYKDILKKYEGKLTDITFIEYFRSIIRTTYPKLLEHQIDNYINLVLDKFKITLN